MSSQSWRVRAPGAPLTTIGALADPPLKKIGRPRKTDGVRRDEAKAAARAWTNAEIQRRAAEREKRPFTVLQSLARVKDNYGYQTTAEALIATGAEDDREILAPAPEVAQNDTVEGAEGAQIDPRDGSVGAPRAVPRGQVLGGERQGDAVRVHTGSAGAIGPRVYTASPLPHTELAPSAGGGVRVRTPDESDEALTTYIHAMMLTDVWTDRMVESLAAEHHRAAHTVRMMANRAKSRMDATLYHPSIVTSLYRRTRLVADIALEGAVSVREPAYLAVALRALEQESKAAGLLPKDAPAAKTPAELKAALQVALARVEGMIAGDPGEGAPPEG